jgi:hypothetical protein
MTKLLHNGWLRRKQLLHARAEHLRMARESQMQILASAQAGASPLYVIAAAEFWLARWQGNRHPTRGRRQAPAAAAQA